MFEVICIAAVVVLSLCSFGLALDGVGRLARKIKNMWEARK